MGFSNKTSALFFFFIFNLNLLFSSHVVTAYHNPTPTPPPPPSTHAPPTTCNGTPPSPPTGGAPTCPLTILSLGACVNLFNRGIPLPIGIGPARQCCSLVQGLVDAEARLCLCVALKASPLNAINVNLALPALLTACGRNPSNARCS